MGASDELSALDAEIRNPLRFSKLHFSNDGRKTQQECIPVGCVPSAAVPVSRGGGVPGPGGDVPGPGGCTWSGGMYLVRGGIPGPGGTWSRGVYLVPGGVYLVWGVPGLGGCTLSWGVPAQVLPLSPPCGQTHACKNITFATSLRTVIN